MVQITTTILLLAFFALINVDLVSMIHFLRELFPCPLPDKDNTSIVLTNPDFFCIFYLGVITFFIISCFVHILIFFSLEVYFIPFNANLNTLRKSDRIHAMPYFKQFSSIAFFCVTCFLSLDNENFVIFLLISYPHTLISKTFFIVWNILKITHHLFACFLSSSIDVIHLLTVNKLTNAVINIVLIWYMSLLLKLCFEIHPNPGPESCSQRAY